MTKRIRVSKLHVIVLILFLLAFLVRWWQIPDHLFFGFEQGRDAQVIGDIYTLKKFVIVGPKTDIGGIFHGPFYYYLMVLPYSISGGNPLVASAFLILLSSLSPVIMFFLFKNLLRSLAWGIAAAFCVILGFEFIIYARWLSNVTLALPFVLLTFYMLLKYHQTAKDKYFVLSVISASLASQFEVILSVEFLLVYILLFCFKVVAMPNWKTNLLATASLIVIFSPLIFFDFRHQHIIFNSILSVVANLFDGQHENNLFKFFTIYASKLYVIIKKSLFYQDNLLIQLSFSLIFLLGLYLYSKTRSHLPILIFLLIWSFMSISILLIAPGLDQAFAGTGLGWISLFIISVNTLWKTKGLRILAVVILVMMLFGWIQNLQRLERHQDIFFVTIQKDLNLADQKKVLNFIHDDSGGKPYKMLAYTIPYLHPEGWQYLQSYYYPKDKSDDAKLIYIIIEKAVAPVWEEKWTAELGKTKLLSERKFGLIRVQKRMLD